jgi:hypothetical protein
MSEFLYQIQKRGNLSALSDDAQGTELLSKIPPPNLREADLRLGILFNGLAVSLLSLKPCDQFSFLTVEENRTWQKRRVVYTKESIYFAREDDETETKIDE